MTLNGFEDYLFKKVHNMHLHSITYAISYILSHIILEYFVTYYIESMVPYKLNKFLFIVSKLILIHPLPIKNLNLKV